MLCGIDLAKRDMTKTKQVVIVEGYTDVMAANTLAGITTAVATCGTAFGPGHIKMVRRIDYRRRLRVKRAHEKRTKTRCA